MAPILVLLNVLIGLTIVMFSFSTRNVWLRGSVLHPFTILGMIIVLVALTFLSVNIPTERLAQPPFLEGDVDRALEITLVYNAMILLGCMIDLALARAVASPASVPQRAGPPALTDSVAAKHAALLILIINIVIIVVVLAPVFPRNLSELQRIGSLRFSLLPPYTGDILVALLINFAIYLSFVSTRNPLPYVLFVLIILINFVSGSRARVILPMIAFTVWIVQHRETRLPWYSALLAIPVISAVSGVILFFFRVAVHNVSFSDFLVSRGGIVGLLFSSKELIFAKQLLDIISSSRRNLFKNDFLDVIVYLVTTPIPRSLIPWKPRSTNFEISYIFSYDSLILTGSHTTVGLITEAYLTSGFLGGALFVMVVAAIFGFVTVGLAEETRQRAVRILPSFLYCIFLVYRGSLTDASLFFWLWAGLAALFLALAALLHPFFQQPVSADRPQRTRPADESATVPRKWVAARFRPAGEPAVALGARHRH